MRVGTNFPTLFFCSVPPVSVAATFREVPASQSREHPFLGNKDTEDIGGST
jgi:hypothetical protein